VTLRDKPNILDKLFVLLVPGFDLARIVVPPLGVVENMCSENKYGVQAW